MPLITLTRTDFGSLSENVPRIKLSNMYVVENPISVSGASFISRPSLDLFSDIVESDRIRGIFYQSGSGTVTIYVVGGDNLYTLAGDGSYALVGPVPGDDFCTFASTIYGIAVVSDGLLYIYDGATLSNVAIPDAQIVSDVTSLDNYFIVGIKNSNRFYWVKPGEITIDGLDFTSAERNPDDIVSPIAVGDELWIIGQSTVEIFVDSGDSAAPFVRIPGRVYQVGCKDKHSLVKCNLNSLPALVWVTPTNEVILAQGSPQKISNESIEELLRAATTYTAWTFRTNRHDFYVLTTDNETVVYDLNIGSWYRWASYQSETWDGYSGIQIDGDIYAVNATGGNIYKLNNAAVDGSSDFIVCEVGGFVPNPTNNSILCNAVTLFLNYGSGGSYTTGPLIEMRWSDDGGNNWSDYYQNGVGSQGSYDTTSRYRSLGSFNRPGRRFEFRFSELSSIRIDGAVMNDSV